MAFTKIAAAGIGSTETVTLHSLEVLNNATVGGVLTYEDVTNVDSIGIVTARAGVLVGSGITLSKDGDVFFTGIATGNGSGLTALNASNISSGTVPTARLGSGTASSSTFLRGDSSFQTITTDLVGDTTPQLGGNLDVNTKNILFGDSGGATDDRLTFGAGTDLSIYHDGSHSRIVDSGTGNLILQTSKININNADGTEAIIHGTAGGAVEVYHDNSAKLTTSSSGVTVTGTVTADGLVLSDNDEIQFGNSTDFRIYHDSNNSYIRDVGTGSLSISGSQVSFDSSNLAEYMVRAIEDGAVELYHNGVKKLETTSSGVTITGNILAAGTNADIKIEAVGSGGHVKFRTTGSDRWYVEGTNGDFLPQADNTYDIGNSSYRVANIYTNDLHCSNKGSSNDVDGTWGDYTIQEGESDLFLINNRSGKKYKFNLTEVS